MDKIDLDTIYGDLNEITKNALVSSKAVAVACMKEAIYQALVLASKKANIKLLPEGQRTNNRTPTMWDVEVDKQSILDIEKLII